MPVSVSCPANEPSFSARVMKGRSRGASSAVIEGKFTAFVMAPRSRWSDICSAICSATFSCASEVAAPRCGVHTTFGWPNSGLAVAGSSTNTSKAAPATWPESSAARSAASSTSPPRAQLTMRTPLRVLAGERQHQRDRVLGRGDRVAERRVHHDDALGGGGRNVDVVDADAGAPDHAQRLRLLENLRRHLGGRADREPVVVADDLGELVLVLAEAGLEIDLDAAILEDLHGGGRECVGDENARGGHDVFRSIVRPASS